MANGQILRGEVYWVCVDDSVGSEQQTGRPALIISGDKANEKKNTVIVAYLTTGGFGNFSTVTVNYCGKPERVLCDQLRTIDKQRLTRYAGKLTEPEMRRVSGALAICMCLRTDGVGCEEVFDKDESEELFTLKAEVDMWKRLYEKTMNQLVDFKVDADLKMRQAQRTPVAVEQPVVVEQPPVVEEAQKPPVIEAELEPEPEKVDLNSCSVRDLKKCGCTEAIAELIIAGRPYTFVDDLMKVNGITNVGFNILKHKVCVNPIVVEDEEEEPPVADEESVEVEEPAPVKQKKININTVTRKELQEKLGIGEFYAYLITGYRNKNGKFVDLKELLEVPNLAKTFYERYKDRLTIDDEDEGEIEVDDIEDTKIDKPESEVGKVNINTATAQEISDVTGWHVSTCYAITGHRKRNGLFESVDEIAGLGRISESMLAKHRDKLTIGKPKEQQPKKLNINQASLRELMDIGFEKRAAALIVNERKKFGNFRSLDELSEIPEISGRVLRKLRDKLEV